MGKSWPSLRAQDVERIIQDVCGQPIRRGKGSHRIYKAPDGSQFTFAFHDGVTVRGSIVRGILIKDVKLTKEEAEGRLGL